MPTRRVSADGAERVGAAAEADPQEGHRPTDARLVPLAVTAWLCALVVPLTSVPLVVVLAAALAALAIPAVLLRGRFQGFGPPLAVILVGGAVFCVVTVAHVVALRSGPVPALAADAAVVAAELRVRTDAVRREPRGFGSAYVVMDADLVRVSDHGVTTRVTTPVVVTGPLSWSAVEPGTLVRTVARLSATDPGDRAAAVVSARSPPAVLERPGWLDRCASSLRAGLRAALAELPREERGLVPALVVGDVSGMPASLVEDFRTAGLSHLTAVSGANLTIMLAFVLGAARWAGVQSWGLPLLGALCAVGLVVLARPEPSVLRAAAMGLVGLVGLAAGSRRYGVPALALAVIVLLALDPWLGRSYGFALSVLATAGILALAPAYTSALSRWLPRFAATALAIPLAAQLACTPLVAVLSGSVSVVAVAANLVAAPAVFPATVLGLTTLLVASVSEWVAAFPGRLAGYAARWIVEVAQVAAGVPGASVAWSASVLGIAVLVVLCAAVATGAPAVLRRRGPTLAIAVATVVWIVHPVRVPGPPVWITGWPPEGWFLVACDVGQGDGLVLRAGPKAGVVVDTGPDPDLIDTCLAELAIDRVPYVLLTHFHDDHIAGLPGVLRGRAVGEIGIRPHGRASAEARWVSRVAAAAGTPVTEALVGERRRVGAVTWSVLGPAAERVETMAREDEAVGSGAEEGSAENDASVVVIAESAGVRALLTGDVEPAGQRELLRSGADVRASVLKVPHHGSRYQDQEFLRAVGARLALISVGADNDYGHPAPSTVSDLASTGTSVARTDQAGSIAVVNDGSGLGILTRGRPRGSLQTAAATPDRTKPGSPAIPEVGPETSAVRGMLTNHGSQVSLLRACRRRPARGRHDGGGSRGPPCRPRGAGGHRGSQVDRS